VVFPFAILLVCMSTRINLGVRHILAIYPLLAVIAGCSMSELIGATRTLRWIVILPLALALWVVTDFVDGSPGLPRLVQPVRRRPPGKDPG